jgi:solute:Na+ symporter, SSS family
VNLYFIQILSKICYNIYGGFKMNISLFIFLLFGLQFIYWAVGRYTSKNLKGEEDYFLAGKSVQLFPLMMTFLATQVGGGVILGSADEAYKFGWPVLFYPLGSALGLILLGMGVGRKLAAFKVSTVAQIFEVFYRSPMLRKIASLLSIISLFMILVAQIIASNKFLIGIGLNSLPLFIAFWAIVIIYTAQGGLRAVISTDMVQAAFFSTIFFLCLGFALYAHPSLSSLQLPQLDHFAPVSSKLCGWLLMPLLFMVIEQDMGQRCFAGASPRVVSRASLLAGIGTLLVCIVPIFFGSLAKGMNLEVPSGGSVLMAAIAKTTNPWITALVGCAVLAAIISTATSLINAISSNLANDFKSLLPQRTDSMRLVKVITSLISIGALFFAFYFDNIVDLLIQSYELSVSALFVPILFALFKKRGVLLSACSAILFGTFGFFLFRIYPVPFPKEILSLLLSFCGYGCGEIISRYRVKVS